MASPFRSSPLRAAAAAVVTCALTAAGALLAPAAAQAAPPSAPVTADRPSTPQANAPTGAPVSGRVLGEAGIRPQDRPGIQRFRDLRAGRTAPTRPSAAATGSSAPADLADQAHRWWGTELGPNGDTGYDGVTATHTLDAPLRLSGPNDFLYAPTTKARSNSCIELVTVHTQTSAQVWAWDWCNTDPAQQVGATVDIDSAFLQKYGTTVNGRSAYGVRILQTDAGTNTWSASLYNVTTATWDPFFTSQGTDQTTLAYGWDMFEYYSDQTGSGNVGVCQDLSGRVVETTGLKIHNPATGAWSDAGPADATVFPDATMNPSDYFCPGITGRMASPYSAWQVTVR
ncbi:hypothetical protein AB0O91_07125 [Kitasatospora sp. NPDC089797]|uniref:hypothetical protein n=1 Tax=Kitasatospora sp. NPDC089797 TaxID=3155298 RepID=UPI00344A3A26